MSVNDVLPFQPRIEHCETTGKLSYGSRGAANGSRGSRRNLAHRGGTATVHQLATDRDSRRRVRRALQLGAREGLVTSPNGERYTLTEKAWEAIRQSLEPAADAA